MTREQRAELDRINAIALSIACAGALLELPLLAGSGAAAAGGTITVAHWGRAGLYTGDWVMVGGRTWVNYVFSGKWQWGLTNRFASFSTGETFVVASNAVR